MIFLPQIIQIMRECAQFDSLFGTYKVVATRFDYPRPYTNPIPVLLIMKYIVGSNSRFLLNFFYKHLKVFSTKPMVSPYI